MGERGLLLVNSLGHLGVRLGELVQADHLQLHAHDEVLVGVVHLRPAVGVAFVLAVGEASKVGLGALTS